MLLTYLDRIKPGHAFPDVRDHEDAFVSACISVLRLGSWLLGSGIMQRHGRGGERGVCDNHVVVWATSKRSVRIHCRERAEISSRVRGTSIPRGRGFLGDARTQKKTQDFKTQERRAEAPRCSRCCQVIHRAIAPSMRADKWVGRGRPPLPRKTRTSNIASGYAS